MIASQALWIRIDLLMAAQEYSIALASQKIASRRYPMHLIRQGSSRQRARALLRLWQR